MISGWGCELRKLPVYLSYYFNLMTDTIRIQEAGVKVDPMADFNTETEKTLGKIVKEK